MHHYSQCDWTRPVADPWAAPWSCMLNVTAVGDMAAIVPSLLQDFLNLEGYTGELCQMTSWLFGQSCSPDTELALTKRNWCQSQHGINSESSEKWFHTCFRRLFNRCHFVTFEFVTLLDGRKNQLYWCSALLEAISIAWRQLFVDLINNSILSTFSFQPLRQIERPLHLLFPLPTTDWWMSLDFVFSIQISRLSVALSLHRRHQSSAQLRQFGLDQRKKTTDNTAKVKPLSLCHFWKSFAASREKTARKFCRDAAEKPGAFMASSGGHRGQEKR